MTDGKRALIRRANIISNRRNSQASALRQLRVVIRKLRRAARDGNTIKLWPTEAEAIVRFYSIKISPRRVGAPELSGDFQRWIARAVYWWRGGGSIAKVANSIVAEEWSVSRTTIERAVRDHGAAAQDWLKQFGGDRESTAVLIAQSAQTFRMLAEIETRALKPSPTRFEILEMDPIAAAGHARAARSRLPG